MRPERLVLRAFGPYAGEQVVDFRQLRGQNFLLISGPVGAGKTAILDGLSCALYGSASGGERQELDLRSQFSDPARPTEVELDFKLGRERYRAVRTWGNGHPPSAALWQLGMDGESPVAQLADNPEATDRAVSGLLGLGPEQFRQAVLLPQGKFMRFLAAPGPERERLLADLFQTGVHLKLQESLLREAERAEQVCRDWQARVDQLLHEVEVATLEELHARREELQQELQQQEERQRLLRSEETAASEQARRAEGSRERLLELEVARKALAILSERAAEFDQRRARAARLQRLGDLRPLRQSTVRRVTESRNAEKALEKARAELQGAEERLEKARQRLGAARARQSDLPAARRRLHELESAQERLAEFQAAEKELTAAEGILTTLEEALEQGRRTSLKLAKVLAQKQARLAELEQLGRDSETLSLQVRERKRTLAQARQVEELRKQLARARKAARDERLAQLEERLARLEQESTQQTGAQREDLLAELARELKNGTPCPVCGAKRHPRPAHMEAPSPDAERAAKLRHQLEQTRRMVEQARQEAGEKHLLVERVQARLDQAMLEAPEEVDLEALAHETQELETRLAGAKGAADEAARLREELGRLKQKGGLLAPRQEQVEQQRKQAEARVLQARAVLQERRNRVEELGSTPEELTASWQQASNSTVDIERELAEAVEEDRAASEQWAAARAATEGAASLLEGALERQKEAQLSFKEQLRGAGLEKASDLDALEKEEAVIRADAAAIRKFDEELASARHRVELARQKAAELELEDPAAYLEEQEAQRRRHDESMEQRGRLSRDLERVDQVTAQVAEARARQQELEFRLFSLQNLARVAGGENRTGMAFHTFVVARLLEQILSAGDQRLRRLSKGRYELRPNPGSPLELAVHDQFSGGERPVATLSGGEAFLASLSLALGLSDTLQARGGPSLESLFVDEGFGYLDPEALDLAMGALQELSQEGRLVAVVSQLPELRERVATRLEVRPGPQGSHARFV